MRLEKHLALRRDDRSISSSDTPIQNAPAGTKTSRLGGCSMRTTLPLPQGLRGTARRRGDHEAGRREERVAESLHLRQSWRGSSTRANPGHTSLASEEPGQHRAHTLGAARRRGREPLHEQLLTGTSAPQRRESHERARSHLGVVVARRLHERASSVVTASAAMRTGCRRIGERALGEIVERALPVCAREARECPPRRRAHVGIAILDECSELCLRDRRLRMRQPGRVGRAHLWRGIVAGADRVWRELRSDPDRRGADALVAIRARARFMRARSVASSAKRRPRRRDAASRAPTRRDRAAPSRAPAAPPSEAGPPAPCTPRHGSARSARWPQHRELSGELAAPARRPAISSAARFGSFTPSSCAFAIAATAVVLLHARERSGFGPRRAADAREIDRSAERAVPRSTWSSASCTAASIAASRSSTSLVVVSSGRSAGASSRTSARATPRPRRGATAPSVLASASRSAAISSAASHGSRSADAGAFRIRRAARARSRSPTSGRRPRRSGSSTSTMRAVAGPACRRSRANSPARWT